jgi:hypothetical protein
MIHRTEPNRPHISSDSINVKERETKNQTHAPTSQRTRQAPNLRISVRVRPRRVFGGPFSTSAPPVRGYLRIGARGRKGLFREIRIFCDRSRISNDFRGLVKSLVADPASWRNFLSRSTGVNTRCWVIHRVVPKRIPASTRKGTVQPCLLRPNPANPRRQAFTSRRFHRIRATSSTATMSR